MKFFLFLALLIPVAGCKKHGASGSDLVAYAGATIIDGNGGEPIPEGVLLVHNGKVTNVGGRSEVRIPDGASVHDLSGKTIMPGMINGHGHVGNTKGIEGGHYSRENVIDNLSIYARYGVTTVVSLGDDKAEATAVRHVNDSTPGQRARLFTAGEVITGDTPEEAVQVVSRNQQMGVDFMKIRVDDNLGSGKKMTEDVYREVIDRSHALGYRIATHMYYLEDAKKLLNAGSDLIAHSVRDRAVDEDFIKLIKEKGVGYCPTLTREVSTFVYADTAEFFSDPFFTRVYDEAVVAPLKDPVRQKEVQKSRSAKIYRRQLPVAMDNLKRLADSGVPVVFGTDSGVPTRFMGYFEHMEMEMMQDAGLTPMQIIVSATKNPAQYLGLKGLGTLAKGNWADFLVLDADPLADVRNIRKLSAIYIGGEEVIPR